VSNLVAPSVGVLVHLNIVGFLMVIFLRGLSLLLRVGAIVPLRFPLWFSVLVVEVLFYFSSHGWLSHHVSS
jgi:hypothetical protein